MMSDERYRSKLLDLAVRVINAYVEVAYSKDQIALAEAQKAAYKEQLTLNDRLMSAGEGTITDVSETQARYSLAEAQVIEARDALDAAQRELEVIIGIPLNQLDELQVLRPGKFKVAPLIPSKFEEWQKIALENNPVLAASRHGVDAAKYDVERNRAGFMPQVQLYASHSENDSSSDNTVNQKYRTDSIGVQVSMPIYSGGGVSASTRQAAARYGQAMYEMDAQTGTTLNDLRKQYNLCISSRAKVAAYELAVQSATTQVTATRQSVLAGQRVNVDVLNAEQQLYSAQRDLASAKYAYIKSWITLLSDSGTLDEKDVLRVAQYFARSR
jgi:protease secretion system outer membrane protein